MLRIFSGGADGLIRDRAIVGSAGALSRTRDLALVMVSHSPETAALCDRVLELRDGMLQAC